MFDSDSWAVQAEFVFTAGPDANIQCPSTFPDLFTFQNLPTNQPLAGYNVYYPLAGALFPNCQAQTASPQNGVLP